MQINPKEIVERGIVSMSEFAEVQQVGIDFSISETVNIRQGGSVNVSFNETIALPDDVFSLFNIRSSFSRRGVFATTGVWDPGYVGSLGCTLYNLGDSPIRIEKNTRVGQMLFFKAEAASSYEGQWQGK